MNDQREKLDIKIEQPDYKAERAIPKFRKLHFVLFCLLFLKHKEIFEVPLTFKSQAQMNEKS